MVKKGNRKTRSSHTAFANNHKIKHIGTEAVAKSLLKHIKTETIKHVLVVTFLPSDLITFVSKVTFMRFTTCLIRLASFFFIEINERHSN